MKIHFTLVMALANIAFAVAGTSAGDMSITTFMEQNIDLPVNGSARIIGGRPIRIDQAPYMCSLRKLGYHCCGCSILSGYFILTAAQCVTQYYGKPMKYSVYVGTANRIRGGSLHEVQTIKIPKYSAPENDIAVLELITQIDMSLPNRKVVGLPNLSDELKDGQNLMVTGWGTVGGYNWKPEITLRRVFLKRGRTELCRHLWDNKFITTKMICTKITDNGPCLYDAGGPLVAQCEGGPVQYGIYSFGGCGNKPAVYTRVSAYIPWINRATVRYDSKTVT